MITPTDPSDSGTLGPGLDQTVIEELVPGTRRVRRSTSDEPLLEVRGLHTSFHTRAGVVRAVDGIDFEVRRGEIMGLVGESGCGKSVTSLSILGLVTKPGKIEGGQILFDGTDLLEDVAGPAAAHPWRAHLDDLPAADVGPEPRLAGGSPDR